MQDIVEIDTGKNALTINILKIPGNDSHMLAALSLLAIRDILVAFMPLVGESVGVSPMIIGALLGVRGATSVISGIFISQLSARFSRNVLVLASLLVSAAAIAIVLGVLALVTSEVVVAFFCMTVGVFTV